MHTSVLRNIYSFKHFGTLQTSQISSRSLSSRFAAIPSYLVLSKHKLNTFIVFSTFSGYSMHPGAFHGARWTLQLAMVLGGTALCSFSAATFNQLLEVEYDKQMTRTCSRPLPTQSVSLLKGFNYALATGAFGVFILSAFTNVFTAALGGINIALYSLIYTPLKRSTVFNTWIGAIVGAIPGLMGWSGAAATSQELMSGPEPLGFKSFLVPLLIYTWQFPHFFTLSWYLRRDYARAGYVMLSLLDMKSAKRLIVMYSLFLPVVCFLFAMEDLVDWMFLLDSSIVNSYGIYKTMQFYTNSSNRNARKLFLALLIQLPTLMILILIHHWINENGKKKLYRMKTLENHQDK